MRGSKVVVLGVEKKSALQLQDPRTVRKVAMLDDHVCVAFAGELSAYLKPASAHVQASPPTDVS